MFVFIIRLELQLNVLYSKFVMLNLNWIYQIFRKYPPPALIVFLPILLIDYLLTLGI